MRSMKQLSTAKRVQVIGALVEGSSIASIVRLTGVSKTTILKLIADLGYACQDYHDAHVHSLNSKRIQCDEIWAFCHSKQKNVSPEHEGRFGYGDVWTWTAIDADSKLMVSWRVGDRDANSALRFMTDVADRLLNRVQLTTDGLKSYLFAVECAFGNDIDFAQLVKIYGPDRSTPTRYSPPALTAIEEKNRCGSPDPKHISTSFVERANLTIRMQNRRFTRLTNAFSKKFENHVHALALYFMFYNFVRIHKTLKVTPAMAAGVSATLWTMEDIAERIEVRRPAPGKRGPYKKRSV